MPQMVTDYYGITEPVPFVDVNLTADTRLFVDPARVRLSAGPQPFSRRAAVQLDTFLEEVNDALTDRGGRNFKRARELFGSCPEPYVTRLGMAAEGYRGHGVASGIGLDIVDALASNGLALLEIGAMKRMEHLHIFVEGVGADLTSDITTRVVMRSLVDFTTQMMSKYPSLASSARGVRTEVMIAWDESAREWAPVSAELPVGPDGHPILPVPTGWVGRTLLPGVRSYWETTALGQVQHRTKKVLSNGKVLATPKYEIKTWNSSKPVREVNRRETLQAFENGIDLPEQFERRVKRRKEDEGNLTSEL